MEKMHMQVMGKGYGPSVHSRVTLSPNFHRLTNWEGFQTLSFWDFWRPHYTDTSIKLLVTELNLLPLFLLRGQGGGIESSNSAITWSVSLATSTHP